MRYGIPAYRLPRDVLDAEIERILALGVELRLRRARSRTSPAAMREGGFDAAFLAVGAHVARNAEIPGGTAARRARRGRAAARHRGRASGRCSAGASSSTAAATPRWTRPAPPGGSAPPSRSSSTGAPASGCRPTEPSSQEAEQEGIAFRWLSTIAAVEPAGRMRIERMELDEQRLPAADRRVRGARRRQRRARARPGRRPGAARTASPASRSRTASCRSTTG